MKNLNLIITILSATILHGQTFSQESNLTEPEYLNNVYLIIDKESGEKQKLEQQRPFGKIE